MRARYYLFTIILSSLIIIALSSKLTLAAPGDMCDCENTVDCESEYFCDTNPTRYYTGSCNFDDPYSYQCAQCRYELSTCRPAYNDADCCAEPGLNCTYGPTNYHCCPNGYTWDSFSGTCKAPVAANPCAGNGSNANGNNYCASLGIGKNLCCGAAGSGHCEECCALANCPGFCEYCNSTGAFGTWNCDYQINQDLRDDCGSLYQVCDGAGGCKWIPNTPPTDCTWPPQPVFENGKIYNLIMCTYNCSGQCPYPDPYVSQPDNWNFCKTGPGDNPFWGYQGGFGGCTRCMADAMADCLDICVVTEGDECESYASIDHPNGCCDPDDECSNNHCCPAGRAWNGTDCGPCNPMPTSSNWVCNLPHTGGSASCTCGGPCYTGDVYLPNGSIYYNVVQNCGPMQRCIQYHPDPVNDPDMPTLLKVCSVCRDAADCCVAEGGTAVTKDLCCDLTFPPFKQYISNGHCCPLSSEWNSLSGSCILHDPCYTSTYSGSYCYFMAPNSPAPMSTWWNNPFTTLCIRVTNQACCYNNTGLFGYILPSDPFYFWHQLENIVVY